MATPSDASMISHIYLASRKEYLSFAPLIHSDADIYHWIHDVLIPNFQVWVVEQDNVMIGMMAIIENRGINWIEQLYLLPEMTGCGVGSLFLEKVKSLQRPIRLRTFQENHGARRFYEHHGFKILEFADGSGNEEQCPDMLFEWAP
jgi:GNAT superfamily N-acetyltransferase